MGVAPATAVFMAIYEPLKKVLPSKTAVLTAHDFWLECDTVSQKLKPK